MKKFAVCYQASFQELKHVKTLTTAAMLMAVSVVLGYFTIELIGCALMFAAAILAEWTPKRKSN